MDVRLAGAELVVDVAGFQPALTARPSTPVALGLSLDVGADADDEVVVSASGASTTGTVGLWECGARDEVGDGLLPTVRVIGCEGWSDGGVDDDDREAGTDDGAAAAGRDASTVDARTVCTGSRRLRRRRPELASGL